MPSPQRSTRGSSILQQALNAWVPYTFPMERFALLHESLIEAGANPDVMNHLLGALERWTAQERIDILDQRWGGIANGTPIQAQEVEVERDELMRVYAVIGFYNVPRVFVFLYVHAYLWKVVMELGPYEVLKGIVDDLDPR